MSKAKKSESAFDRKVRIANEKQENRYERMEKLRDQHRRQADKICKLEIRIQKLQDEIDR
jgi:hypothetical protein